MPAVADPTAAAPFAAADLEFAVQPDESRRRRLGERTTAFRPLRQVPELLAVETLQRDVFGVTERDPLAASALVTVPETGGEVTPPSSPSPRPAAR